MTDLDIAPEFGVSLDRLMKDGEIPVVVQKCIDQVEKRGLSEVGIYRIPGTVSDINQLRKAFNQGIAPLFHYPENPPQCHQPACSALCVSYRPRQSGSGRV